MKNSITMLMCMGAFVLFGSSLSTASEQCSKSDQQTQYLLLDSRIIENVQNAKLTLGEIKKHPANPLFGEDKPWEPRFDNLYANVIYDEEDKDCKMMIDKFEKILRKIRDPEILKKILTKKEKITVKKIIGKIKINGI